MKIERVTEERFPDVIRHLRNTFFADEPLNKAVKLCRKGEGHVELERHSLSTLGANLSVMAVDERNQVVGVALNGVLKRGDVERAKEELQRSPDERFKKIFAFLYGANLKSNLFDDLQVDQLFEIRILSVDSACRGQGLATQLMLESELLAVANGFQVMKADATGVISRKILSGLGFGVHYEVRYDYSAGDEEELPRFIVEPPHDALRIMYKCIG